MQPKQNKPFKRVDRVADLIREITSEVLLYQTHHMDLEPLTITAVVVTPDMSLAKVYYRTFADETVLATQKKLSELRPILQKELGKKLHMKRIPSVRFFFDESLDYASKIEGILHQIKTEPTSENNES